MTAAMIIAAVWSTTLALCGLLFVVPHLAREEREKAAARYIGDDGRETPLGLPPARGPATNPQMTDGDPGWPQKPRPLQPVKRAGQVRIGWEP